MKKPKPRPSEQDVLKRLLQTPPKPKKTQKKG